MEIFDSGLLGEGVLPTMRHAAEHLLKVSLQQQGRTSMLLCTQSLAEVGSERAMKAADASAWSEKTPHAICAPTDLARLKGADLGRRPLRYAADRADMPQEGGSVIPAGAIVFAQIVECAVLAQIQVQLHFQDDSCVMTSLCSCRHHCSQPACHREPWPAIFSCYGQLASQDVACLLRAMEGPVQHQGHQTVKLLTDTAIISLINHHPTPCGLTAWLTQAERQQAEPAPAGTTPLQPIEALHLDSLYPDQIRALSQPTPLFSFDFAYPPGPEGAGCTQQVLRPRRWRSGTCIFRVSMSMLGM